MKRVVNRINFGSKIRNPRLGLSFFTIFVIVSTWEFLSQVAFGRLELIFPSIIQIIGSLVKLLLSGRLNEHIWITAQEIGVAVFLAAAIGIPLGSILGTNEYVATAAESILYYFSSVPKIVLYPIFLVAVGVGVESKILVGFLSAIFPITVNSITGSLNMKHEYLEAANTFGATRWQLFKHVYIPFTITYQINGLRLGIGVAIISVHLAEMFASRKGLGNQIQFFFQNLMMDNMYAVLLFILIIAFSINIILLSIQKWLGSRGYGIGAEDGDVYGF